MISSKSDWYQRGIRQQTQPKSAYIYFKVIASIHDHPPLRPLDGNDVPDPPAANAVDAVCNCLHTVFFHHYGPIYKTRRSRNPPTQALSGVSFTSGPFPRPVAMYCRSAVKASPGSSWRV